MLVLRQGQNQVLIYRLQIANYLYTCHVHAAPPTKPEGISVISTTATSLTLSWMEPVESYGQDVLFYAINCTSTKHSFELEMVHNTTITIETSRANTNYSCCISARNSVGFGGDECITVVTAEGTPTNITGIYIYIYMCM